MLTNTNYFIQISHGILSLVHYNLIWLVHSHTKYMFDAFSPVFLILCVFFSSLKFCSVEKHNEIRHRFTKISPVHCSSMCFFFFFRLLLSLSHFNSRTESVRSWVQVRWRDEVMWKMMKWIKQLTTHRITHQKTSKINVESRTQCYHNVFFSVVFFSSQFPFHWRIIRRARARQQQQQQNDRNDDSVMCSISGQMRFVEMFVLLHLTSVYKYTKHYS